jgi:hypothetical protein
MVQEMHHKPTWNVHVHEINIHLNLLEMYMKLIYYDNNSENYVKHQSINFHTVFV